MVVACKTKYSVIFYLFVLFQKKHKKATQVFFTVLEVHVQSEEAVDRNSQESYKYRVVSHYGTLYDVEVLML